VLITDPGRRLVAMHLYEGLLKVVDTRGGRFADMAVNVRLEELGVIDVAFLHSGAATDGAAAASSSSSSAAAAGGAGSPLLALLHEDADGGKHVSTYFLDLAEAALTPGPWTMSLPDRDIDAHLLIPVPGTEGGVVIAGGEGFVYKDASTTARADTSEMTVTGWTAIEADVPAFLVGDAGGRLHRLEVAAGPGGAVTGLSSVVLGSTSIASSICPLFRIGAPSEEDVAAAEEAGEDAPVGPGWQLFVGSGFGDSQLVAVADEPLSEEEGHVREEAAFDSLGPVMDMAVMDLGRQGQSQVVTCSGAFKEGSLRVVRNGVGVEEQATVELVGVRGLWAARSAFAADTDAVLVSGFAASTRVLSLGEAVEEVEPAGMDLASPTLLCANVVSVGAVSASAGGSARAAPVDALVQVTSTEARLASSDGSSLLASWRPPSGTITHAAAGDCQVALALSGGRVVLLDVHDDGTLREAASTTLPHDVSCLSITPLVGSGPHADVSGPSGTARTARAATVAAVGLWEENSVRLLALPSLAAVGDAVKLSDDYQSRSAQLVTLDGTHRLFVGMGDGTLSHFVVDEAAGLRGRKSVQVGSRPLTLGLHGGAGSGAPSEEGAKAGVGSTHLLVAGDRPTAVSSQGGRLVFSNINAGAVECMTGFASASMPGGLALASPDAVTLGTVDSIQKLHIETVPLGGEQPRRIAHLPSSGCVAVATLSSRDTAGGDVVETSFLRLFDTTLFEPVFEFELDPTEQPLALETITLDTAVSGSDGDDDGPAETLLVLGTAFVLPDEDDPSSGRVLVFRVPAAPPAGTASSPITPIAEFKARGGVFALAGACGRIFAGIGSRVAVLALTGAGPSPAAAAASSTSAAPGPSGRSLVAECSFGGHILALHLAVAGGVGVDPTDRSVPRADAFATVAVGDLTKSVSMLRYSKSDAALVEIARDPSTNWTTAVACTSEDRVVACESSFNLYSLHRDTGALTDEERGHLALTGTFHLGDQVNVFRKGSLVMLPPDLTADAPDADAAAASAASSSSSSSAAAPGAASADAASAAPDARSLLVDVPRPQLLYGTVSGAIGAVLSLPASYFHFLRRVEAAMAAVVPGVGGLKHDVWRSWQSAQLPFEPLAPDNALSFVDGDLVERALELPAETVEAIAATMNAQPGHDDNSLHRDGRPAGPVTAAEILETIDEMARLH